MPVLKAKKQVVDRTLTEAKKQVVDRTFKEDWKVYSLTHLGQQMVSSSFVQQKLTLSVI